MSIVRNVSVMHPLSQAEGLPPGIFEVLPCHGFMYFDMLVKGLPAIYGRCNYSCVVVNRAHPAMYRQAMLR